ncbi:MAG: hypothetical protein CL868_21420 [Cytophagaceae bacterium]|nr:hypothetical protein [Cytophagaceae bacterium]
MNPLDNHNKDNGLHLPKGYLEQFEDGLYAELELRELLPSTDGFVVPQGYFEKFESRLKAKITQPKTKIISIFRSRTWMSSAAAIAAILVLAFIAILPKNKINDFDDLTVSTLENYLQEDGILEKMSEEDLDAIEDGTTFSSETFANEAILDYVDIDLIDEPLKDED